jgi:hypothetical protein
MSFTARLRSWGMATATAGAFATLLGAAPGAQARDVNVRSFDGISIRAHF